nr:hypothetical protein [Acetatifactor sp.]
MLSIVLVDNELKILPFVLSETDWIIEALVTVSLNDSLCNNDRIKNTYHELDFWNNDDLSGFEYNDLADLWEAQLKIENATNREIADYQIAKYTFYRGYAVVKRIMNRNVDMIIVKGPNHGYCYDRLLTSMATIKGIHSFNIEEKLLNKRGIYDNLSKKLIPICENGTNEVDNSLFCKAPKEYIDRHNRKGIWGKIY